MKVRLLLTLAGLISFAVPASIAQDAMKIVTADELVWKDDPLLPKGAQTAVLIGDPSKAETIVLRVKFPPRYEVPPHNHSWSEVVTVLSGTCWNGMGDHMEKGVMLSRDQFSCFLQITLIKSGQRTRRQSFRFSSLAQEILPILIRLTIRETKPNNQTRQIHNCARAKPFPKLA